MHKFVYPEWIQKITAAILETLIPPRSFSPAEEQEFRTAHAKRFLPHRRATLLITLFTWSTFAYWDWISYEAQTWIYTTPMFVTIMSIRLAGAIVLGICLTLFWIRDIHNEKVATGLLSGTSAFCCFGIIAMFFIAPTPVNYQFYFFGLILAITFTFGLTFLFAKPLIMQAVAIACFLIVSNQYYPAFEADFTFAVFFYYFCFCFFGVSHAVRFEVSERERFVRERALEEQRQIANRERHMANEASTRAAQEAENARIERKRSVEAMAAAAQQREVFINLLKHKTKERERFIRAAYHDTMQPLSAIGAQAVMMKLDPDLRSNSMAVEALNEIGRSGRDIGESMRGIYDLFQWDVYKEKLEAVSVKKLLMEIEKRFAESAKSANLQFRIYQSRTNESYVQSDSAMLKRIIENLVSNAIKYTEKGGIVVGTVSFRHMLRIHIWDTGIGIAPEQRSDVFEEFYQVDEQVPGIGLGLSIVRLLIERLPEHRISFSSQVDRGSHFSIDLPRCGAPTQYEEERLLNVNIPAVSLAGSYVIIIENNKNLLNGLRALFESINCIVRTATNLKELKKLIENVPDRAPDVVISDYRLRGNQTGAEVAGLIEEHFDWTVVPIVFYSADSGIPKELFAKPLRYTERKGIALDSLIVKVQEAVLAGRSARAREEEITSSN